MAELLAPIETRIIDLLANGRGVDGALGPDAQARAIPDGYFRQAAENADLRDPSSPAESFDRAFRLEWGAAVDDPAANNPLSSVLIQSYSLTVAVGYAGASALSPMVDAKGSEVAATQATRPMPRAMSDARRIKIALEFLDLFRGGTLLDPVPVSASMVSADVLDLTGGRLLLLARFSIVIQSVSGSQYTP